MVYNKTEFAKAASKLAALTTYKTISEAFPKKVAGTKFQSSPDIKELARKAAKASYLAVLKLAQFADPQNVNKYPIDYHSIGDAIQRVAPNFAEYINRGTYKTVQQVPADVKTLVDYVKKGGQGEKWTGADKWPTVVNALVSNVEPEYQEGLKVYLNTL